MIGRKTFAHAAYRPMLAMASFAIALMGCQTASFATDSPTVFNSFEPSEEYPFGQLNPDAPEAVEDYAFMVGEWTCDELLRQGGEWLSYPSTMLAHFYLNGYGVTNFTWTPTGASSMSYQYDQGNEIWVITNTTSPRAAHTVWRGAREGDARVASLESTGPDGQPVTLRITFDNIADGSFDWRLEAMPPSGPFLLREKSCQRV